jgi:hypothetical protein
MRIAVIVEGQTERAFLAHLRRFLEPRLRGRMPRIDPVPYDGRLPTGLKLRRSVERLLQDAPRAADIVIALTDVYTGTGEFSSAADAKAKMSGWVGTEPRFFPHAAQHDFEAWLLPYWETIVALAGSNVRQPGPQPERIDHNNPPAHRLAEIFRTGSSNRRYCKPRDAGRILRDQDLSVAARACPELRALLNTILVQCGAEPLAGP